VPTIRPLSLSVQTALLGLLLLLPAALRAADPDPLEVLPPETIVELLPGSWGAVIPEPGVLTYEEDGGGSRTVQIYLWPANGKTLAGLTAQLVQEGEPVEPISDLPGDDQGIYRPQRSEATIEKKAAAGGLFWLTVAVQGAATPEEAKRLAVGLARRGAVKF
jgi:hypothetical protein